MKGAKRLGMRIGNWLTAGQGRNLLEVAGSGSIRDKSDHAMLSLLLGCGLRRAELTGLTVDHLRQRDEHWAIINLFGKGGHVEPCLFPAGSRQFWIDDSLLPVSRRELSFGVSVEQELSGVRR